MAVVTKHNPEGLNEAAVIKAIAMKFNPFVNMLLPNVQIFGCEMDLLMLTPRGFVVEIEVKLTKADWENDKHKKKWTSPHYLGVVDRFFYAVPHMLLQDKPDWIPDTVGLIAIHSDKKVSFVRDGKKLGGRKMDSKFRQELTKKAYYRFWQSKLDKMPTDFLELELDSD